MANPEHLKILKQGVQLWNRWRDQHQEILPDLSSANLANSDLREANLSDAELGNAILTDANLSRAKLCSADLGSADLTRANLAKADLFRARLDCANLNKANLVEVRLADADLGYAKLRGANLCGARFDGANLSAADLDGADVSGATVCLTTFADNDLRNVRGLETLQHYGASFIGVETFYKSKGLIPESFLRGCGVPEEFIRFQHSLVKPPIQFHSCFISYSHEDRAFASLLHDRLQGRGIRCWLDEHQLLPGDDLHEGIDRGIRLWDKVLLCASKASLTSWWVDGEINRAFQKEAQIMKERGKKVLALIPLNLDGFLFSADYQSGKKAEITSRVAANFVGWEKDHALFDRELEKVIRALRTGEGGREIPPPARL